MIEPITPIIILSFKNCELHCCHLDGYKGHREAFIQRLTVIENYFASKPDNIKFRIWYNIDDSKLDESLIQEVISSLLRVQSHIFKIAFIGLKLNIKLTFERRLCKQLKESLLPRSYFTDAEKAKEWLV